MSWYSRSSRSTGCPVIRLVAGLSRHLSRGQSSGSTAVGWCEVVGIFPATVFLRCFLTTVTCPCWPSWLRLFRSFRRLRSGTPRSRCLGRCRGCSGRRRSSGSPGICSGVVGCRATLFDRSGLSRSGRWIRMSSSRANDQVQCRTVRAPGLLSFGRSRYGQNLLTLPTADLDAFGHVAGSVQRSWRGECAGKSGSKIFAKPLCQCKSVVVPGAVCRATPTSRIVVELARVPAINL